MLSIISGCCKIGQRLSGTELGPATILKKLIDLKLLREEYNLYHVPHHDFHDAGFQKLYNYSAQTKDDVLTLGGDHSIGLPTVLASAYKWKHNTKVVWVDAHTDINTFESSPTGNLHGMPVSPLFSLMNPWFKTLDNQYYLNSSQLVYIGVRSIDKEELKIIEQLGIKMFRNVDVFKRGITDILKEIVAESNDQTCFHLSFDIDSLDRKYAPSTGTVEDHGLSLDNGLEIVHTLVDTGKLRSYDLVEYNPQIGSNEDKLLTLDTCIHLLQPYLAKY